MQLEFVVSSWLNKEVKSIYQLRREIQKQHKQTKHALTELLISVIVNKSWFGPPYTTSVFSSNNVCKH